MVQGKKVFVIADDDAISAEKIRGILEKNGYVSAAVVCDGMDAVFESRKNNADVVIVKDNLPILNGYSVSASLRKSDFAGIILIETEDYSSDCAEKVKQYGADGYIVKPVTERFLIPWLRTAFVRITDMKTLSERKKMLLSELEEKRLIEEAVGKIAFSLGIKIDSAKEIFEEKTKAGNTTQIELAKLILADM